MKNEFSVFKLGEVVDIIAGGDKPKVFSENKTTSNMIPVFANAEKKNGLQGYTNTPRIIEPAVTVAARGSNVGFVAARKEPFLPVVRLLSLIPNKEIIDVDYLFYNLKQNRQIGTGSGQPQITIPDISNRSISLPPLYIQKENAKILSDLDAKIELNNKINTELEAMAKLIYDYWFVQFDFPDKNGKPYKSSGGKMVYSEELKREIPAGWECKRLSEFAKTGSGGTPLKSKKEYYENGNIPWINSGEVNMPFITKAEKYISEEGLKNSSAKIFSKGTILMAMYGATAGKVSLMDLKACTNQAVCGINPNEDFYSIYLKFGLEDLYEYLINLSSGSARDNLSQEKIRELKFAFPPDEILKSYHKIANPLLIKILNNMKQNHELAELRDWLLPMLMNGQVKVGEREEKLNMAAEPEVKYGDSNPISHEKK